MLAYLLVISYKYYGVAIVTLVTHIGPIVVQMPCV